MKKYEKTTKNPSTPRKPQKTQFLAVFSLFSWRHTRIFTRKFSELLAFPDEKSRLELEGKISDEPS